MVNKAVLTDNQTYASRKNPATTSAISTIIELILIKFKRDHSHYKIWQRGYKITKWGKFCCVARGRRTDKSWVGTEATKGSEYNLLFLKYILLIILLQLSHILLTFILLHAAAPLPQASLPPISSCPWVTHRSSLASQFPILFFTSLRLFLPAICASYSLFLFPHSSPIPTLLVTLHVISISVILFLF